VSPAALILKFLFFAIPDENGLNPDEKRRQSVFSLGLFMTIGGIGWMLLMFWLGLDTYSLIPGLYILLTAFNLFILFDQFPSFSNSFQIIISLIFPYVMQWIMGGYYASGLVMLWSSISFLATFSLSNKGAITKWALFFLLFFFISFWFDNDFQIMKPAVITPEVSRNLLVFNILMIGLIIIMISVQRIELDAAIIRKISNANEELISYKKDLEAKIEERTRDLETNIFLLKETKNEMKKALIQAREATESKGLFLTTISHEIRTPLNAILGYAQIISMKTGDLKLSPELNNYIAGIQVSGNHLLDLVNNVLDYSRIESGKLDLSIESVNIHQVLKKIYEIGSAKCKEKGISCSYYLSSDFPELIETDSSKLTQILLNLVSNAMKFTNSGKNVKMLAGVEGDFMVFKVEDEGVGIKEEDLNKIFAPYIQLDRAAANQSGGTGLGLAITKKLVDLFNGQILVSSKENLGSTFTVKLPLMKTVDISTSDEFSVSTRKVKFLNGQKVLVVEDNPVNMEVMESLLKELALTVFKAGNGQEGVDAALKYKPDVIFMDIHMPVMDGLQALNQIASNEELRHIPVICLTADVFGTHRKNHLSIGFSDHLSKPVDFSQVISVLEKYLTPDHN
jgi:signal transduction histidine kinase/CheY-like chemotaxis protein